MSLSKLEDSLAVLYKGLPHLPENGRKALVQWVPWINLVVGLLTLWSAWILWHWAHYANAIINSINSLGAAYGIAPAVHRLDFGIWLGLIVLIVEAVLLLMAFSATKDRKKNGWDLMFYVAMLNVLYAVILVFTNYGGIGHLLGEIIASAIGLYFLFEIRSYYGKAAPVAKSSGTTAKTSAN